MNAHPSRRRTDGPSPHRAGVARSAGAVAAALVAVGLLAAGCAEPVAEDTGTVTNDIELSPALAYRDGDPAIEIVSPADRATVTSPFLLEVDATNFELSPSGTTKDGHGHLHVLIDRPCVEPGVVISPSETALDIEGGASEVLVELEPGRHELCVQVGDGFHVAVALSDRIVVDVVDRGTGVDADSVPVPGGP